MRNKMIAKMGVAALAMCVAGVASAQTSGPTGFSARIGAHWPRVGDTDFAFGLDYKFQNAAVPAARGAYWSYLGLSADYYGRSDNWNVPLAVTYNVRNNQLVFTGGIGVDIYRRFGDNRSGLGGQLGLSYDFSSTDSETVNPLFVQAKYYFANDSDLSGFAVYLGYRF